MTATITRPKPEKSAATKSESPYKRLHVIIPIEDMLWASQQKPSVTQLWQECWTADPYGSRWMPLSTEIGYSTFISAKKILSESGLFIFKPDKSIQDGRETVRWMVKNLHGSRIRDFWEKASAEKRELDAESRELDAEKRELDAESRELDAESRELDAESRELDAESRELGAESRELDALNQASILGQSRSEQGFQKPSQSAQEHHTNSTKEFVWCKSDTKPIISHCEEAAAIAPLVDASRQTVQGVSEKEEGSPTANDCTTLALVDAVQSNCSAAPDTGKWSHEAIAARSNLRPARTEKLNRAGNWAENPGFEYLVSCWNDDPALQILIRKLLVKFPQWGIAIMDGVLVG